MDRPSTQLRETTISSPTALPHDSAGAAGRQGASRARPHGELSAPPPQPGDARTPTPRLPRHPHEAEGMPSPHDAKGATVQKHTLKKINSKS